MSFSFSSLVRLLVLLALGTTMLAVGLSRFDPPRPGWRTRSAARYSNINEYFLNLKDRIPHWLDSQTGQILPSAPEDGDVLESASCSPWIDEKGQAQVVGRWSTRTASGPNSISSDFGLARYTFPGGEMLDHVSTEVVPVSSPCWYPGTSARVLFAAGDGMLYHFAFEPESWQKRLESEAKSDTSPQPLRWRCPMPGDGTIYISDLTWPEDPRMAGCLVVALREKLKGPDGSKFYSRTQLWWLKLDFAGTEVLEAGRLLSTQRAESSSESIDLRTPTIGSLADGRLVLAYLTQRMGIPGWELRLAPIELVGDHQTPHANEAASVVISTQCHPSQPTLSPDGKWLNFLTGEDRTRSRVARFSTAGLFKDPA